MKCGYFYALRFISAMSLLLVLFGCAQTPPPEVEQPPAEDRVIVTPREPEPLDEIDAELWFDKACGATYQQGEKVIVNFRTTADAYVTIYDIDTTGNVSILFPNREHPDNFVQANQTYTFPNQNYSYDLIVEGPEGIEYIDLVASTDPYYHWNYNRDDPPWLYEWGLKGRQEGMAPRPPHPDYQQSPEYRNRPPQLAEPGTQSIIENFTTSQYIHNQIGSKLTPEPRDPGEPPQPANYETETCYFYVVADTAAYPTPSYDDYLRQQQQAFERIPGLNVTRSEDRLIVAIPSTILFDYDSYQLQYDAREKLAEVSDVLIRYPQTSIIVAGHTDSTGSDSYNQTLSEQRAQAVANELSRSGVQSYRISAVGYGESRPIASNSTEAGRQRNRRVELEIIAQ